MKKYILLIFALVYSGQLFGMLKKNKAQSLPFVIVDITDQPVQLKDGRVHYSPNSPKKSSPSMAYNIRRNSSNSPQAYNDRMEWLYNQPVKPPVSILLKNPLPRSRSQSENNIKTKATPKKKPGIYFPIEECNSDSDSDDCYTY